MAVSLAGGRFLAIHDAKFTPKRVSFTSLLLTPRASLPAPYACLIGRMKKKNRAEKSGKIFRLQDMNVCLSWTMQYTEPVPLSDGVGGSKFWIY